MKISKMVNEFAGDFIMMAETDDRKQSHLNLAVSAWNIAILPRYQRKKAIEDYLVSFKQHNPQSNGAKNLKSDLKQLIKIKNRMFPSAGKPIVNAYLENNEGVYSVYAATIDE